MVRAAARRYKVTVDEIYGPSKCSRVAVARWYAWVLIRFRFRDSFPSIGSRFGGRNHATVMNGIARWFGYERPSKNISRGIGLAIETFFALHEDQLQAETQAALDYDLEAKKAFRQENEAWRAFEMSQKREARDAA